MIVDTHAHITFSDFDKDRQEVIKDCLDKNIWMINVGTNYQSSQEAVILSQQYSFGIYAAVGVHPENMDEEDFDYQRYKNLIMSSKEGKVVAVGEIGLDYWQKPKTNKKQEKFKKKQRNLFLAQVRLAEALSLPLIIHCRRAHEDLLKILENHNNGNNLFQGVIHCFTGDWTAAQRYLALGFHLGFNGIIFKMDLRETIRKIPLERMLVETDCPFLIPPQTEKKEKTGRNNPRYVRYVIESIASERKAKAELIARKTTDNAKKLFKLDK
jgi:TatD DNase family protein